MPNRSFILASQSPRRAELLGRLGYQFRIEPAHIDESRRVGEMPAEFVRRLAQEKAAAIAAQHPQTAVLGADTIVVQGDEVLGKPVDQTDAMAMLRRLSGGWHEVMTAVCVCQGDRSETVLSRSEVLFDELDESELEAYCDSGEPEGKAGAYGIQGLADIFVREIRGSYSGIVGLPLQATRRLLELFEQPCPALRPSSYE